MGKGASTFTNGGAFASSGACRVNAGFLNQGVVQVGSGKLSFTGAFTNNGIVTVSAASLTVSKMLSGSGTLQIGNFCVATLDKGASTASIVAFMGGTDALSLSAPLLFAGLIDDFAQGASIDLLKTTETAFNFGNGVLMVKNGVKTVASLHFAGSLTTSSFVLSSDGHGGIFITHS